MGRIWKFGDNVNTDMILPGKFSPYMTSENEFVRYTFIEVRPEFSRDVRPGDIIVAGKNFGCGSSREYAPRALSRLKVVIIVKSFARIFYRNALNLGLTALFSDEVFDRVSDGDEAELDLNEFTLRVNEREFTLRKLPEFALQIAKAGDIIEHLRRGGELE